MNHRTFQRKPPHVYRRGLLENADLRKQIYGACFRKSQRFRREAEIRFFRFYDTPPTHLKVKFFRGGVNNCLQIYMRSKRGTPDALGGDFL